MPPLQAASARSAIESGRPSLVMRAVSAKVTPHPIARRSPRVPSMSIAVSRRNLTSMSALQRRACREDAGRERHAGAWMAAARAEEEPGHRSAVARERARGAREDHLVERVL